MLSLEFNVMSGGFGFRAPEGQPRTARKRPISLITSQRDKLLGLAKLP